MCVWHLAQIRIYPSRLLPAASTAVERLPAELALALKVNELLPVAAATARSRVRGAQGGGDSPDGGGAVFAGSGIEARKRMLREHLLRFVPLSAHVQQVPTERPDPRAPWEDLSWSCRTTCLRTKHRRA
jgi:hypothetical protein